jgi:predicted house-cleaning noncanonical NTP pyrophosphatase (MazG superfamily)
MVYDKLVRDRTPDIITAGGRIPVVRVAAVEEYRQRLQHKLHEAAEELGAPDSLREEELAELLEILLALASLEGLSAEALEALRAQKAVRRGSFDRRLVLVEAHER